MSALGRWVSAFLKRRVDVIPTRILEARADRYEEGAKNFEASGLQVIGGFHDSLAKTYFKEANKGRRLAAQIRRELARREREKEQDHALDQD